MRRPDETPETGGPIEPADKEIRQEPYKLPGGFVWSTCDVDDATQMLDIYKLLNENYVEDDDNMFRCGLCPGKCLCSIQHMSVRARSLLPSPPPLWLCQPMC